MMSGIILLLALALNTTPGNDCQKASAGLLTGTQWAQWRVLPDSVVCVESHSYKELVAAGPAQQRNGYCEVPVVKLRSNRSDVTSEALRFLSLSRTCEAKSLDTLVSVEGIDETGAFDALVVVDACLHTSGCVRELPAEMQCKLAAAGSRDWLRGISKEDGIIELRYSVSQNQDVLIEYDPSTRMVSGYIQDIEQAEVSGG